MEDLRLEADAVSRPERARGLPEDSNRAAIGLEETEDREKGRRLSRPVGPHESDDRPRLDDEIQTGDGTDRLPAQPGSEALREAFDLENRGHDPSRTRRPPRAWTRWYAR
jgi:hypothetical protein